jgi:hypothetical protein
MSSEPRQPNLDPAGPPLERLLDVSEGALFRRIKRFDKLRKEKAQAAAVSSVEAPVPPWGFPEFFVISQTFLPAILYLPGTQGFRLPLRIAAYAISLGALVWRLAHRQARKEVHHPSVSWLVFAIVWLLVMVFHPTTNTVMAGLAQTGLYLAVMSPVFWAPALVKHPRQLLRLLAILLVCNGVNSLVGVLQVYDPDRWMPAEFSVISVASKYGISSLTYVNNAGQLIVRPPGLFDTPGAVCAAGMVAAVIGMIFAFRKIDYWKRAISLGFAVAGVGAVYLSQVRSALLTMSGMMLVYVAIIWLVQKERGRATLYLGISAVVVTVAFTYSVFIGGQAVVKRMDTLTVANPFTTYYESRGAQVAKGFNVLLPEYPFGAGLGRWGQMRLYFGDEENANSPQIWAEVQYPGWILDGGIVLVLLYCLALIVTVYHEVNIARRTRDPVLRMVSPLVIAINAGAVALTFSFVPFLSPIGLQFWFLAGALHGVAYSTGLFNNERVRADKRRFYHLGRDGSRQL